MYQIIKIPKQDGGFREIRVPDAKLKKKQLEILGWLKRLKIHPGYHIHAYMRGRSVRTNAEALLLREGDGTLRSPDCILKIDITDFFHSITQRHVTESLEYERAPLWLIDEINDNCFAKINGQMVLPQGAPTSPLLSSVAMKRIISMIRAYIIRWNRDHHCPVTFSAYCDNLTFGCDSREVWKIIYPVSYILESEGFEINESKTKFHHKPARLVICGVQINDKIGPKRSYWRSMRADLHNAITDLRAAIVPAGFYLDNEFRKRIRKAQGIEKKNGLTTILDLNQEARKVLDEARKQKAIIPIPMDRWKGKISFITSLDPDKGATLKAKFSELENLICSRKAATSSSAQTTP